MRKYNQEILDKAIIENILRKERVCRIAMPDLKAPYILPFNYGYHNNELYIHCAREGKKIDLLRKNPVVSFEVDQCKEILKSEDPCKWSTVYRSVTGYGNIEIVDEPEKKIEGLNIIMRHNGALGELNFSLDRIDAVFLLKLKIGYISAKQSSNWDRYHQNKMLSLESERLICEEITMADLEEVHRLNSMPEIDEFNTQGIPESLAHTRAHLERLFELQALKPRPRYTWKIILKRTGQFIGMGGIGLSNDKFKLGEIFYNFHPDFWNQGYATELVKMLVKTGFEKFRLHKVEAGVATENQASIRVLEKAGFTREGRRRKVLPIRGEWVDNFHYAIVETDI